MSVFAKYRFPIFCGVLLFFATLLSANPSMASLLLAPKRVVFDGRARSATVALLNTTGETKTYDIGWKLLKIKEDSTSEMLPLDKDDPYSVPNMVVYSPRRVTIKPNGRQSVRLSLRRPADLPVGEYRGHLVFATAPESMSRRNVKEPPKKGISLSLNVGIGISIPVIVRQGEAAPFDITIQDAELFFEEKINKQKLRFGLAHTPGAKSSYGAIRAFLVKGNKEERVGQLLNVAVYPEQPQRIINLILNKTIEPGSTIRLVYEGSEEYAGSTLAERIIQIGH